ncbi:hypothetical protein ABTM28_21305, partial [Acinetobacter baumannii]
LSRNGLRLDVKPFNQPEYHSPHRKKYRLKPNLKVDPQVDELIVFFHPSLQPNILEEPANYSPIMMEIFVDLRDRDICL